MSENAKWLSKNKVADAVTEYFETEAVTFADPLECDCTLGVNFTTTITGNTTVNLTNLEDGMSGVITLTNDVGGAHTLAFGAAFTSLQNGSDAYDDTGDAINIIDWSYDGTNVYYRLINIL